MVDLKKPYWCKNCGWSREEAEKRCSSANCKERRDLEDYQRQRSMEDDDVS